MTAEEVITAIIFGAQFKVIVATLSERTPDDRQLVEIVGYGDKGLTAFNKAMNEWKYGKRQ